MIDAWPSWIWMIALPIVTSPFVYLVGRLLRVIIK